MSYESDEPSQETVLKSVTINAIEAGPPKPLELSSSLYIPQVLDIELQDLKSFLSGFDLALVQFIYPPTLEREYLSSAII